MSELTRVKVFLRNGIPDKILLDGEEIKNLAKADFKIEPNEYLKMTFTVYCESVETVNQT